MKHGMFSFILFSHDTMVFQLQLREETSGFQLSLRHKVLQSLLPSSVHLSTASSSQSQ